MLWSHLIFVIDDEMTLNRLYITAVLGATKTCVIIVLNYLAGPSQSFIKNQLTHIGLLNVQPYEGMRILVFTPRSTTQVTRLKSPNSELGMQQRKKDSIQLR